MSKIEKANINSLTNIFLETNKNLKHIFLLVDIRHLPSKDDQTMYNWLIHSNITFTIVLNKADKLSIKKQLDSVANIHKILPEKENVVTFSSQNKQNLNAILNIIYSII